MKRFLLSLSSMLFLLIGSGSVAAQVFTDVVIGSQHICAVTDNSDVECTTASFATRYDAPADLPQLMDITAGDQHTCGIDLQGQAVCWGSTSIQNPFGPSNQLDIPAIDQPLIDIGAGHDHTCAVDVNGRVWCWGLNANQQTQPPGDGLGDNGSGFVKVEGGSNFSCGIQTDSDIACWTDKTSRDNGRSRNVEGPFIDLALSRGNQCGLKSNGSIECWINRFDPPNNGPYSDLVVSAMAICGLDQNQKMDCTFSSNVTFDPSLIPLDTQFTAIESGLIVFRGSPIPFCGLTVAGSIECIEGLGQLPPPPGTAAAVLDFSTIDLSLAAERYETNRIEIFWPITDGILMEIYRNDILLETTDANASWFDTTEQTENPAVYKIRPRGRDGNVGAFSSPLTIDIETGEVTYADSTTSFDIVQPAHTVDSVRLVRSGSLYTVVWTGSTPGTDGLKGYEVRINKEVVGFNDGFRLRLDSFNPSECNLVSVAAISEQGTFFDYRSTVYNRRSSLHSSCPDP